jgi:hypothetical protein
MKIKSTTFLHKNIHLGTWKAPGLNKVNQTDHVLVSLRHLTSITDVKSSRGPNCDTDHYLVKIKVRKRIASIQKMEGVKPKKWDVPRMRWLDDVESDLKKMKGWTQDEE